MSAPIIWNGSFAKLLKDDLKLGDTARIITIAVDPTVVATDGEAGSIALRTNGSVYVKTDAGVSVNWSLLLTAAGATFDPNTILVNQNGDVLSNQFGNVLVTG